MLETRTIEPEGGVDLARYRRIGEKTTYLLGFEPGKLFRIAVVRPKYGLKDSSEPVERGEGVRIAPLSLFPIYEGMPSSSLLAEILLQKYEYHMLFYRQIKQFAHLGMTGLKEATIVGWFKRTMELLRPLYDALVREIFSSGHIQSDETTIPVINSEKHQADKEYLWMARAVMERLSAFFYNDGSRAGDVIKEKTDEYKFRGYLQCDGYPAYASAYGSDSFIVLVFCLVHIRRHFEHAIDENRKDASWFLAKIRDIYLIESECDKAGIGYDDSRKEVRQSRTRPLMQEMKEWLEANAVKYSSRLSTCRNHDINPRMYLNSEIESMPYFMGATHEELVRLLPHKWKEYHPEAIMDKIRNLAK